MIFAITFTSNAASLERNNVSDIDSSEDFVIVPAEHEICNGYD
ncbi:hypothetical protein [Tissierella praeacuta]|nr:hypothetical protein [Tissierella praeacuta]